MSKHLLRAYHARFFVRSWWKSQKAPILHNQMFRSYDEAFDWAVRYASTHLECVSFEIVKRWIREDYA